MPAEDPPKLLADYATADLDLRVRQARIGCMLAIVLMLAGVSLDLVVYPQQFVSFLGIRLLCDLALAGVLALLYTPFGRRHVRVVGISWAMLPGLAIAWMVMRAGGADSSYYAGLNLVMIGISLFMPWTFVEVAITCGLTIGSYLAACVLASGPANFHIFLNNLYFLLLTGIICIITSYFTAKRRFEDFRLRHELDKRNAMLGESNRRLAELDRLKSEFFANISHELRTPLTLILAPVENLLNPPAELSPPQHEALTIVRQQALRLLRLINDLLELVRLEEGVGALARAPMDLAAVATTMADSVRHLATLKKLTVHCDCPGPLPVEADAPRLEKVFLNLLTNAIKFTPEHGRISLRCFAQQNHAVAEITDTGIGISEENLHGIFDRFRQIDASSTRQYRGVGIGLALARDLVQAHGGTLTVRSTPGTGSTFRIALPLAAAPVAPAATLSAPPAPAPAAPDPLAEMHRAADRIAATVDAPAPETATGQGDHTLLVVDDEPDMRRFLVSFMARRYRVLQAGDGPTGLAAIRRHRPDIVLLDLMLPGIDGLHICEQIKADPQTQNTRIILLTARTDEQSKITALRHGADDFLTKPFSTIEVETRVANLLRTASLENSLRQRNDALADALARLKEAEVQLVQTEKMSALGQLAAGLMHEVNNPLNFTLTALSVARQASRQDPDLDETLRDIEDGMTRIREIVSDLRTFAYASEADLAERFDLGDALTMARRLVSHALTDVAMVIDNVAGQEVCGSKNQISHVFMNLLVNAAYAVKAARGINGEIRISAGLVDQRVQVAVRDNGTGMSPEHVRKAADPFFTTKAVGQGTGLGLSICHTIIKNHGGTLRLESLHGQWTEVIFDLPSALKESASWTADTTTENTACSTLTTKKSP